PARELLLTCPEARLHRREDHDHAVDRHTGAAGRRRIPDVAVQSWVGLLSEWIAGRRPDRDAPARAERPPLARSALVRNTHIEETITMPPRGVKKPKRKRQYKKVLRSIKRSGRYKGRQKEVAARVVNKTRRRKGETKGSRRKSRGRSRRRSRRK